MIATRLPGASRVARRLPPDGAAGGRDDVGDGRLLVSAAHAGDRGKAHQLVFVKVDSDQCRAQVRSLLGPACDSAAELSLNQTPGNDKAPRDLRRGGEGPMIVSGDQRHCRRERAGCPAGVMLRSATAQAACWRRRNRRPTARPAITLAQARTVAGSGAGTWSIVPPVGE